MTWILLWRDQYAYFQAIWYIFDTIESFLRHRIVMSPMFVVLFDSWFWITHINIAANAMEAEPLPN